jgi:hypothetical protein
MPPPSTSAKTLGAKSAARPISGTVLETNAAATLTGKDEKHDAETTEDQFR